MKRDLKEIAVQLDNLNVPVMGFVFNFAKERKVSSNGNYYYLLLRRGRQEEPKEPKEEQAQKLTQSQQNNRLPFY